MSQQLSRKVATINMKISNTCCCLAAAMVTLFAITSSIQCSSPWQAQAHSNQNYRMPRATFLAARRAADDSRPLRRVALPIQSGHQALSSAESQMASDQIVTGRFHAPAPEQVYQQRIPKSSQFGSQIMRASYRVAEPDDSESSASNEKVVHGIAGASTRQQSIQRTVGAKIMVSDEGLNYPPSKLSADIYGNVAEIVTAPPEAVDSDFLIPKSSRFSRP